MQTIKSVMPLRVNTFLMHLLQNPWAQELIVVAFNLNEPTFKTDTSVKGLILPKVSTCIVEHNYWSVTKCVLVVPCELLLHLLRYSGNYDPKGTIHIVKPTSHSLQRKFQSRGGK